MKKTFVGMISCLTITTMLYAQQQPADGPPKPPALEERLKHVSDRLGKDLSLAPAQKEKVMSAYKVFFMNMDKLRMQHGKQPPPPPPPPGTKEEVQKLSLARDATIKSALSDDQYKKYIAVEKTMRPPPPPGDAKPNDKQ